MRRTALALCLAAAAGLAAAAAGAPSARTPLTLRLEGRVTVASAPLWYGIASGVFRRAGIDLAVGEGQSASTSVSLLSRGREHVALVDASQAVETIAAGADARIVLVVQRRSPLATACRREARVRRAADLAGKRVTLIPYELPGRFWDGYLASAHVDAGRVRTVESDFSNRIDRLVSGDADCLAGTLGGDTLVARTRSHEIDPPLPWWRDGFPLPGQALVASGRLLRDRPDVARAFVRAAAQAWRAGCASPRRTLAAYWRRFDRKPADRRFDRTAFRLLCTTLPPLPGEGGRALGPLAPARWRRIFAFLHRWDRLPRVPSVDDVVSS